MKQQTQPGDQRLLWITDPHCERASQSIKDRLIQRLEARDYDMAIVTGDLATATTLPMILPELAESCGDRQLFLALGNHDFYGGSIQETVTTVDDMCRRHGNLTHLATSAPVRITEHTTLTGHHGWADTRAGHQGYDRKPNPDHWAIGDFKRATWKARKIGKIRIANESAEHVRKGVFQANKSHTQLLVGTHYPPFWNLAYYNGRPCGKYQRPNYVNATLGYMLLWAAEAFDLSIGVLAGHTHHAAEKQIAGRLRCRVGNAGSGHTGVQGIVMV